MEMFGSLKTFLLNHRRKFVLSGIAVSGAVALYYYMRYQAEKHQKCEISDFLESIRREGYFDTIQLTCDQTLNTMSKQVERKILSLMNIDCIVADLKCNSLNSLIRWDELKISAFAQICLIVYGETLLLFTLNMQFAIMGGFMYQAVTAKQEQISRTTQEKYLSLCVNFMKNGLRDLHNFIVLKVRSVTTGLELNKKLTIQGLQDIFWSIQASIDTQEFIDNIPVYLQINSQIIDSEEPILKVLYEEISDLLSAKDLIYVCINSLLHCGFNSVMELLHKYACTSRDNSIPTAKLLPVLHNAIKTECNEASLSSWCKNLICSEKLKILSANVYESYC